MKTISNLLNNEAWRSGWLDLDRAASVEVTSEDKEYPVECALVADETRGWRAADSGTQTIRLIFDEHKDSHASRSSSRKPRLSVPKSSSCDGLGMAGARFETSCASSGISARLIPYVRSRNIRLNSPNVTVLELVIVPDISRGSARASRKSLRLS